MNPRERKPYREGDKIMLLESGEVFTVREEDRSPAEKMGIFVHEIEVPLSREDVRSAGHTRQREDLATFIIAPEGLLPIPDNCVRLDDPEKFLDELHSRATV